MHPQDQPNYTRHTCCPQPNVTRRGFLASGGAILGGFALTGLSWQKLKAEGGEGYVAPPRKPLIVKPIFTYTIYAPREQTSWRPWGGCQTQAAVNEEITRIQGEMKKLEETADFPLKFLPLSSVRNAAEVANIPDAKEADAVVVWANDGGNSLHGIRELKKDTVFFIRWRSGPVYLWYEIISPRFLRNHSDHLVMKEFDYDDVVIDELDAVLWRLRALMGLKNTVGSRILTVGGASGWACPEAPNRARDRLKLDIVNISYPELGKLLKAAREDASAMALAKKEADAYLKTEGTTLETDRGFVDRAFLLTRVFRDVMTKAGASNMTINSCMGTIMPISETTACLPLSLLNDGGCMAFCESDFVVVPSGILLGNISGHPTFLNDPCFPHHNEITLAHCTAPRKMDGKTSEKARIVTHFESDYGAAPKVEMRIGQDVTIIVPDFAMERWLGLSAKIIDAPFRPICRSQIDVSFKADTLKVCENMRGFHWMVIYGDYMKEAAYALKKTNIQFESLG